MVESQLFEREREEFVIGKRKRKRNCLINLKKSAAMKQRKLTDSAAENLKKMLIVTLLGRAVSVTFQSLD